MEKYLLRNSFALPYFHDASGRQILPDNILWRRKEAFSDGVCSQEGRHLYTILQEHINANISADTDKKSGIKSGIEIEKEYYKQMFHKYFPNCAHIVPYYWMPKYTEATDPSARTLAFY
jgi:asparagine synthase (glutamine-hydrolysing)